MSFCKCEWSLLPACMDISLTILDLSEYVHHLPAKRKISVMNKVGAFVEALISAGLRKVVGERRYVV